MLKLYKVTFRHYGPKRDKEGIITYAVATDETVVRDTIDSRYNCGNWKDRDAEGFVYEDDNGVTEPYLQRMLRVRGEANDPDVSVEDAYYGVTHYGWEEGIDVTEEEVATLLRLKIAEDWREDACASS